MISVVGRVLALIVTAELGRVGVEAVDGRTINAAANTVLWFGLAFVICVRSVASLRDE